MGQTASGAPEDNERNDLPAASRDVNEDLRHHVLPNELMNQHQPSTGMEAALGFGFSDVEARRRLQHNVDLGVEHIGHELRPVLFRRDLVVAFAIAQRAEVTVSSYSLMQVLKLLTATLHEALFALRLIPSSAPVANPLPVEFELYVSGWRVLGLAQSTGQAYRPFPAERPEIARCSPVLRSVLNVEDHWKISYRISVMCVLRLYERIWSQRIWTFRNLCIPQVLDFVARCRYPIQSCGYNSVLVRGETSFISC